MTGPAAGLVPNDPAVFGAPELTPEQEESAFWESREELRHVRDVARAQMASPWATLGAVLVRVLSQVPPEYVLPPVIGGHASLNVFLAVVGYSGEGKGAAVGAAEGAYKVGHVLKWPIGTGEGVVKSFVRFVRDKDDADGGYIEQHETSVLFDVNEVDKLAAVASRRGSTILSILRDVWMGAEAGFGNAELERRLKVPEHAYRAGFVVGVQPPRVGVLLCEEEIAGGTPQRFLWLPADDPDIPDVTPPHPGERCWQVPEWPPDVPFTPGRHVLDVWPGAVELIRAEHRKRMRRRKAGFTPSRVIDGHALLCREKVAAALGLLHGHARVTEEDWRLAGVVMRVSDRTRQECMDALATAASESNRVKGRAEGERAVVAGEAAAEAGVRHASEGILRALGKARQSGVGDGWLAQAPLRRGLRVTWRPHFDEAVGSLVGSRLIEAEEITHGEQNGVRYRLARGGR